MALNYDVRENKNAYREISKEEFEAESVANLFQCHKYEEDGKYYQMTIECNMLIMILGLSIGITELTEENHEKVFNRIRLIELVNGTFLAEYNTLTKKNEPHPFTIEMVKNNIGIKTNGFELSSKDFQKKLIKELIGDLEV